MPDNEDPKDGLPTGPDRRMGIVYALGLVSSAVLRIISAFRKTAIVYVA